MKISLITVCYNSEKTIAKAIDSALSQTGVDLEYIVVDGASKDRTMEIVRDRVADRSVKVISEPDKGMYDALNKGIALATGDIIGILNADDELEFPTTLATVAAAFEAGVDAVYGDIRFVRNGKTSRYYTARRWKPWMHRWGFMPPHPSVYVRRELFAKFGNYRTDYRISADYELMVRYFCRNRISTRYIPASIVRMSPGGMSTAGLRANLLLNRENVRAERDNGYFSCYLMMLPKYFYKILGYIFKR